MNAFRLICLSSLVCAIAPVITQPAVAAAPERAVYAFKGSPDGWEPTGGLVTDGSGSFYGATASGGTCIYENRCGTVFRLTPNGSTFTESMLYAFQAGTDGYQPAARVTLDARGDIFGTTDQGGAYNGGTVFELVPGTSGYTETILWSFGGRAGDGTDPSGGVLLDSSGALYGVTYAGGGNGCSNFGGCGTIYRLTPSNSGYSETVLHSFTGGNDGAGPTGELIADTSGRLYGTATGGGNPGCRYYSPGCGTVFALTPSASTYTFSTLYAFGTGSDGRFPAGTLLRDNAGVLYGATSDGGLRNGCGFGAARSSRSRRPPAVTPKASSTAFRDWRTVRFQTVGSSPMRTEISTTRRVTGTRKHTNGARRSS